MKEARALAEQRPALALLTRADAGSQAERLGVGRHGLRAHFGEEIAAGPGVPGRGAWW